MKYKILFSVFLVFSTAFPMDRGVQWGPSDGFVIQPDGKRIVIGWNRLWSGKKLLAIERRLSNHFLDPSFGENGLVTFELGLKAEGESVSLEDDGKILAKGYVWDTIIGEGHETPIIIRLNPNGSLDTSFGKNGIIRIEK